MSEFNNRILAQRNVLECVNSIYWTEELFGLSSGAIRRWVNTNNLDEKSELVVLITKVAEKLFFLSNKSQEQITEEYRELSADVTGLSNAIKDSLHHYRLKIGRMNLVLKRISEV